MGKQSAKQKYRILEGWSTLREQWQTQRRVLRTRWLDRSKYMPHQGYRECERRSLRTAA